jgi:glycosyltransferase involved in cell wall biosynthesis
MSLVDWVVVPSTWWEIFGLVVSEAWMFGRPVIASDIGGLAERVEHEKNGLLFAPGSAVDLAGSRADIEIVSRPLLAVRHSPRRRRLRRAGDSRADGNTERDCRDTNSNRRHAVLAAIV